MSLSARPFRLWVGIYDKRHYDALTPAGEIVMHCWPNAGYLNDMGGTGRAWAPGECRFRESVTHPMEYPKEYWSAWKAANPFSSTPRPTDLGD